jgi:hypothetical protein
MIPMKSHMPLTVLLIGGLTASALAQAGPALVLTPWTPEQLLETQTRVYLFGDSDTDAGADFDLAVYSGSARARFDKHNPHGPAVGVDVIFMDIDTPDMRLPDQLTDQRLGAGLRLGEWGGWAIDAVGGVGFAGDSPYDDDHAWYAHGSIIGSYTVDDSRSWIVSVNYDGNRAVFPDLPLPAVAYRVQASDELSYTLGLPTSGIVWTPTEQWRIGLSYLVPFDFAANVNFALTEDFHLFGTLDSHTHAFHIDGARDHDRVFFQQRRGEGGLRWVPCAWFEIELAGGYAFDQEFTRGWHVLDDADEIEIDPMPYLRGGLTVKF